MYRLIFIFLLLLVKFVSATSLPSKVEFKEDSAHKNKAARLDPRSHIKIFLPSIPYSYIGKSTNAGLIRSYDNEQGWVYDLAKSHQRVDDLTYIFELRKNLKFQDGSDFTVDDVVFNLNEFKKNPIKYTNIDNIDFTVTKLDKYRIKIVLKQKYEMFLTDLARIFFYTKEYIEKYSPKGAETGSANRVPGPFGMGPYILKEGFAVGSKQTDKLELVANPYYWNKQFPKIQKITVYTQLNMNEAVDNIINYEGKLDITPIPFNKKLEVLLSDYAKLIISKSTNTFVIFFNLINGNEKLQNQDVRLALNQALNQQNLLNFVYKNEGTISPFTTSINFKIVNEVAKKYKYKNKLFSQRELHTLLKGLTLKVFTQDSFMFLWKGIEFQLKRYGVKLDYTITSSEKDIYGQLLTTNGGKNTQQWDMLIWGDDDWYYQNPWTVFFIYEPDSVWSTIGKDDLMAQYIKEYFNAKVGTKEYEEVVKNILHRAKCEAYTLRVPSPNKVFAVNKEVIFKPYQGGIIPLWEIEISKNHWSLRGDKPYDKELKKPIKPKRIEDELSTKN